MTFNTLDQVQRQLGNEEQLHNINGLLEQFAYEAITNPDLVISDSTSLGSGRLGMVARQIDYYSLSDQDLMTATQQVQAMSVMGLPLISVKFSPEIVANTTTIDAEQSILFGSY